jgi:hypothetical protein
MASRNILAPCEIKRCVATKKNSGSRLFSGKVFLKTGATMLAITVLLVAVTALLLGLRFSGFVLGLLILLVTTSILVIAIWNGGKPGVVALQLLAMLASVQISYLIGCLIGAQITARAKPTSSRVQSRPLHRLSERGDTLSHQVVETNVRREKLDRRGARAIELFCALHSSVLSDRVGR